MRGAENQSMHSVNPSEDSQGTPALKLVAFGSVKLETMSWIEAIRRKHMTGGPTMPEIPMGKRALAFQRLKDTSAASEAAAAAAAAEVAAASTIATASASAASVVQTSIPVSTQSLDSESAQVSLNLDNIPGMQTAGEKYVIMFTCNVCETRAARKISKKAYNTGVVICRCEKCKNLHLIADRMGVFEDDSWDIQKHMTKLLEQENINIEQIGDLLEVTENDEEDNENVSDEGSDTKADDIYEEKLFSEKK
jgi:methionine-rich copper-binding protein CopC